MRIPDDAGVLSQPLLAFRRDRNICDSLVHGKTNRALRSTPNPCICACCQKIIRSDIKDTADSKSYKVQKDVDCNTTDVVYCLLCDKCNVVVYIGEAERSLKERFTEHLRDVRNGADKPINKHFSNHTDQDGRRYSEKCTMTGKLAGLSTKNIGSSY